MALQVIHQLLTPEVLFLDLKFFLIFKKLLLKYS